MQRNAVEPDRDPRYPTRADDPAWRAWHHAASAPLLPPPGRPTLNGYPGPAPQVTLRLPVHLRNRAIRLAHWRRTSLAAVVRAAMEHYLDEGIDGRAGRPAPRPVRAAGAALAPLVPSGTVLEGCSDAELAQGYADAAAGVVAEED